MWTERGTGLRSWLLLVSLVSGLGGAACGEASAPGADARETTTAAQSQAPANAAPAPTAAGAAEPESVADFFPPGPGREQVLNSCGSCHNVACNAIGQRTGERWDALKEGHRDKVTADLEIAFAYLKANFDDTKPEPKVPPRFLEGGCTPF